MKIAFVGHKFHEKTKSSQFFQERLRTLGDVHTLSFDPDSANDDYFDIERRIVTGQFDVVVCWQSEHIARNLLPFRIRHLVIVPMWDAAIARPPDYWTAFRTATFVSFSRDLHGQLLKARCRSFYFQYFPDTTGPFTGDATDWTSAFFWERRPRSDWDSLVVAPLLYALGVKRLHVHQAPDFGEATSILHSSLRVTTSKWFENSEELHAERVRRGIFVAPRRHEGIGLSFLEAMASGQCVIAPSSGTAHDYISDGINGILHSDQSALEMLRSKSADEFRELGKRARIAAVKGRQRWLSDLPRLDRVLTEPVLRRYFGETADSALLAKHNSLPRYEKVLGLDALKSVTVAITVRNMAEALELTLASIAQQECDFGDVEVLVTDSGSTDDPDDVIEKYSQLPLSYYRIRDESIYDGMNLTATIAQGQFIIFLNAGDVFASTSTLASLLQSAAKDDADVFHGAHVYVDANGISGLHRVSEFEKCYESLREGNVSGRWHQMIPGHQATMTRRSLLVTMPYDTRYRIAADHDFLFRARQSGAKFKAIDELIAIYSAGGFSSKNIELCQSEWHQIYHSFSIAPHKLDEFFTKQTGYVLGNSSDSAGLVVGGYPEEGPYPPEIDYRFRWVGPRGLKILPPSDLSAGSCEILLFSDRDLVLRVDITGSKTVSWDVLIRKERGPFVKLLLLHPNFFEVNEIRVTVVRGGRSENARGRVLSARFLHARFAERGAGADSSPFLLTTQTETRQAGGSAEGVHEPMGTAGGSSDAGHVPGLSDAVEISASSEHDWEGPYPDRGVLGRFCYVGPKGLDIALNAATDTLCELELKGFSNISHQTVQISYNGGATPIELQILQGVSGPTAFCLRMKCLARKDAAIRVVPKITDRFPEPDGRATGMAVFDVALLSARSATETDGKEAINVELID